jgi:hypothetical protein
VTLLIAVKIFSYFLLFWGAAKSFRPFFIIFAILFNGVIRYPVYFVGISLFGGFLIKSAFLTFVFGVFTSEIVI